MMSCSHPGCSWRTVAPSRETALDRYAAHLLAEHARTVVADVPADTIEVEVAADGDRRTRTVDAVTALDGDPTDD